MKAINKYLLTLAAVAATGSAQAAITSYTGNLDQFYNASLFQGNSYGAAPAGAVADIDFVLTIDSVGDNLNSATLLLTGTHSTFGTTLGNSQKTEFTFTNAEFDLSGGSLAGGILTLGGGAPNPGDTLSGNSFSASLLSGSASCEDGNGGDCTASYNPDFLDGLTFTGSELSMNWVSDSGWTGWMVAGDASISAVPVPAAAWLFGSAIIGLAGAKRRK